MRAPWGALGLALLLAGCQQPAEPVAVPSVTATEVAPEEDPAASRLERLRASDHFDEFAEHQRAAQADGARLAWENFAPIVDGERVEWANKAELWDAIAPKIRDEALLLGPEYREPLWDNANAVPNGVSMAWNDATTQGRGHFVEFGVTYDSHRGAAERYWGVLIEQSADGDGRVVARMPSVDVFEADYTDEASSQEALADRQWAWVLKQGTRP